MGQPLRVLVRTLFSYMSNHAETFMSTLQQIEESRDPEALVALFGPDAELINLALTETHERPGRRAQILDELPRGV